jgi:hypothetical protein
MQNTLSKWICILTGKFYFTAQWWGHPDHWACEVSVSHLALPQAASAWGRLSRGYCWPRAALQNQHWSQWTDHSLWREGLFTHCLPREIVRILHVIYGLKWVWQHGHDQLAYGKLNKKSIARSKYCVMNSFWSIWVVTAQVVLCSVPIDVTVAKIGIDHGALARVRKPSRDGCGGARKKSFTKNKGFHIKYLIYCYLHKFTHCTTLIKCTQNSHHHTGNWIWWYL